jgi:hypothetical protein
MRRTRSLVAAALVLITSPAAAQLEDSYSDKTTPATAAPEKPPPPPPPEKPAVRVVYRSMPKRLKYESDDRIPFGYHVAETSGDGLLISGAIVCGLSGALIGLGWREATNGTNDGEFDGGAAILGGIGLAVGLPLLLSGLFYTPRKILVRNDARVVVSPVIGANARGIGLAVMF